MGQVLSKLGLNPYSELTSMPSYLEPKETEKFLLRFPKVAEEIFKQLDNQTLTKCKEVGRSLKNFLDQNKLISTRMIMKYYKNHVDFKDNWKLVMVRVSLETLKQLATVTEEFYKYNQKESCNIKDGIS